MIFNMREIANMSFHHNSLTDVPANALFNVSNVEVIDLSHNRLTDLGLWTLLVKGSVDLSHNQISTISNRDFVDVSPYSMGSATIDLSNNGPAINLTDAVYEMYNACQEVIDALQLPGAQSRESKSLVTTGLSLIHFGSTQINCNCDLYYFVETLKGLSPSTGSERPIYSATCTDGTLFGQYRCTQQNQSTAHFPEVNPRQCKILQSEPGSLTDRPDVNRQPIESVSLHVLHNPSPSHRS